MDIKNAFLNGTLNEEVYMRAPPRFEMHVGSGKVCKLKKSLYDLKQSPRALFTRFSSIMKKLWFIKDRQITLYLSKEVIMGSK